MTEYNDKKILTSWQKNVTPWVRAIEEQQIESRKLVTDSAIVNLVSSLTKPSESILDIGCGEGWLTRELSKQGYSVTGIDAIDELINKARELGKGNYQVLAYEALSADAFEKKFDTAVCNFSLIGETSVNHLFSAMAQVLNPNGYLIIQTLHPHTSCGDDAYQDGWRQGSWEGFSEEFVDPAPWYYRTRESWIKLFLSHDFSIEALREPLHPRTGKAVSLLLAGRLNRL